MSTHAARLAALREQLKRDRLDGFVVPLTDEHMSEYVGAYAQRLAWLTGFQGSAGTAAVLPAEAAIFTDGRYTLQVRQQVSADDWQFVGVPETSVSAWLAEHAARARGSATIRGSTPAPGSRRRARRLPEVGATLVPVATNPVDAVWPDRPAPSDARLAVQDETSAGRSSRRQARRGRRLAGEQKARTRWCCPRSTRSPGCSTSAAATSTHTPVALAYAIVDADGTADLFVAPEKVTDAVRRHLGNAVRVHDRADFAPALADYAGKRVAVDPGVRGGGDRRRRSKRGGRDGADACAIRPCSPRRPRTRPRSPATAPPARATARR